MAPGYRAAYAVRELSLPPAMLSESLFELPSEFSAHSKIFLEFHPPVERCDASFPGLSGVRHFLSCLYGVFPEAGARGFSSSKEAWQYGDAAFFGCPPLSIDCPVF